MGFPFLPAGLRSPANRSLGIREYVNRHVRLMPDGRLLCPPERQSLLPDALRDCFVHNLRRESPAAPSLDPYDSAKRTLRLGAAQQMAATGFKQAIGAARPADNEQYADR